MTAPAIPNPVYSPTAFAFDGSCLRNGFRRLAAILVVALPQLAAAMVYEVTEIGNGFAGGYSGPIINSSGQVTGYINIYTGGQRAFVWNKATGLRDLGTLGGQGSYAYAINEAGQTTGQAYAADGTSQAFFWNGSEMLGLGTLGGSYSVGIDLNSSGHVVGYASTVGQNRALYWDGISTSDIGTLGGSSAIAVSINNAGQATGTSMLLGDQDQRAYLWSSGSGMRDLGTLGGANSSGYAVNTYGWVTGFAQTGAGVNHAFLWDGTQMRYIGGGMASEGWLINDKGQVTGTHLTTSQYSQAFLWDGAEFISLGTVDGVNVAGASFPRAINSDGHIVGMSQSLSTGAKRQVGFFWNGRVMVDMNSLLPRGSNWVIQEGLGINDRGQMVAAAYNVLEGRSSMLFLSPPGKPASTRGKR